MEYSSRFVDIYSLDRPRNDNILEGKRIEGDYSNVIFLGQAQADKLNISQTQDGEMMCDKCEKISLFIYDSSLGMICPPCMHFFRGDFRVCTECRKKHGCDSCGGVVPAMVKMCSSEGDILLCVKDKCLMPFGYYIRNTNLLCSCERDIVRLVNQKLPEDLHPYLDGMMNLPRMHNYGLGREDRLGDLSTFKKDQCVPCQIDARFTRIKSDNLVNGYLSVCNCLSSTGMDMYSLDETDSMPD